MIKQEIANNVFIMLAQIHFRSLIAFKDERRLKDLIMQDVDNVFLKEEKCRQIIALLNLSMQL